MRLRPSAHSVFPWSCMWIHKYVCRRRRRRSSAHDQGESPKFEPKSHDELVEALKTLVDVAEVHVTRLSSMSREQQIALMSRAEVRLTLSDSVSKLFLPPDPPFSGYCRKRIAEP